MRAVLHDGACEDAVRAHGLSLAAAAVTLILSLLLVNRQEEAATGSTSMPSSMVSVSFMQVAHRDKAAVPSPAPAEAALASQVVTLQEKAGSAEIAVCVQSNHIKDISLCTAERVSIANERCLMCGLCGADVDALPTVQVSRARPGALCSPLPAAVLALAHNFTAAQSMQEPLPASLSVLDAHATDAKEHFELASSLFKKVQSAAVVRVL